MAVHQMATHDNVKKHKCLRCKYITAYKQDLNRHRRAFHANEEEEEEEVPSTEVSATAEPTAEVLATEGQTEEEEEANQSFYSTASDAAASDELPLI
mgnify:CR=1 FL=1